MTRLRHSILTDTVAEDGSFKLWYTPPNRHGRWPKHDHDSVEDHMQQIFSIPYRYQMVQAAYRADRYNGHHMGWSTLTKIEYWFLFKLMRNLKERGFNVKIKAKGHCSRKSKGPWAFYTDEYLIYAEDNGFLLKLIGLDNIEEEIWKAIFADDIQADYPGLLK
jgi:spermidine/putrescine-binding protein